MRHRSLSLFALPATSFLAAVSFAQKPTPAPRQDFTFFESKVRPTFLASCVNCHGKDQAQRGLRLDQAITPEKAKLVVQRIRGEGGKPRMPVGGTLSPAKILAIEEWVKAGAPWPTGATSTPPSLAERGKSHWAFQPLVRPAVPQIRNPKLEIRNPIDAFVQQKLAARGLKLSPTASRRELIRRVTYDLTGLPPTPEEVAVFESDRSPNAYEKLIDRLLASPHYGEKWARIWLDLVRYAETNSYERDNPKPYVYKYRDYVIRAFNQDKPYDQFVKEQLAGDEMPDAVGDAILATTYYRLGIWDDEPADKLQAEYDDLDDIVATTGQTFLGLTMDCARCHDHKLDPIPQKDYYRFLAFFHNINRYKNGGPSDESQYFATMSARRDFEKMRKEILDGRGANLSQIAQIEGEIQRKAPQLIHPADLTDVSYKYYERDWKRIPEFENEPVIASGILKSFISIAPRMRNEDFAFDFNGKLNVPAEGDYTFRFVAEGGYRFTVAGEKLFESFASDGAPIEKTAKKHLKAGKVDLNLIFNQRRNQHGLAISWSGPGFASRPLSALDSCGAGELPALMGPDLAKSVSRETADRLAALIDRQAALEKQAPPTEKVLCVTEQSDKPVETHVLLRGVPTAVGDRVEAAFPECISGGEKLAATPPPGGKSTGLRTALANWIASPKNPLTARVIVNRVWQNHFGRGIVRTPSDFGLTGAAPTHPKLLDWLASEFIAEGWSFKKLHKLILMSNTYKQSSRANQAALAADPQNDLFWRFDMRRLTAEEIRDSLLAVSGNLNPAMFGPSVYPEIPKDILAAQSRPGKDWYTERMTPQDVCRRSIYVFEKRSLIYPLFASFDLPETDRPAAMRFASTQPTQALGQINGPLFNQQAGILAERVRKEVGSDPRSFTIRLFSLVLQRPPTEKEIAEGTALYSKLQQRGAKPELAQKYVALMALNLDEFLYID